MSFTVKHKGEIWIEEGEQDVGRTIDKFESRLYHCLTYMELYYIICGGRKISIEERFVSPFTVAEKIYGFDISIYGICGRNNRSHDFQVDAENIGVEMRSNFHGSHWAKTFAINYELAVAMHQMVCSNYDIAILAGFLDIITS